MLRRPVRRVLDAPAPMQSEQEIMGRRLVQYFVRAAERAQTMLRGRFDRL